MNSVSPWNQRKDPMGHPAAEIQLLIGTQSPDTTSMSGMFALISNVAFA